MTRYEFPQDEVERAFEALAVLLAKTPLPTETGEKRTADAGEFMLMHAEDSAYWFKHRDSRNYLSMDRQGKALAIPTTERAFMRGTFDALPVVAHCGKAIAAFIDPSGELQRAGLLIVE